MKHTTSLLLALVLVSCEGKPGVVEPPATPQPISVPVLTQVTCSPRMEKRGDDYWILLDDGSTQFQVCWGREPVPSVMDPSHRYRFSVRTTLYEYEGHREPFHEVVKVELLGTVLGPEATALEVVDQ